MIRGQVIEKKVMDDARRSQPKALQ